MAYSRKERIEKLNELWDGSVDFCINCMNTGEWKGSSAAMVVMRGAREEMMGLSEMCNTSDGVSSPGSSDIIIRYEHELPTIQAEADA